MSELQTDAFIEGHPQYRVAAPEFGNDYSGEVTPAERFLTVNDRLASHIRSAVKSREAARQILSGCMVFESYELPPVARVES